MKKNLFLLPLAAAMMLTACSDSEPAANGGSEQVAPGSGKFLAVSIISNGCEGSRAEGDNSVNGGEYEGEQNKALFEDGTDTENTVNKVRFYFFTATDAPSNITKGGINYYEYVNKDKDGNQLPVPGEDKYQDPNTVDKILDAIVIIEPGQRLPAKVIAVVNPSAELGDKSLSLSAIKKLYGNYAQMANNENKFVMTNSVYYDVNGIVEATPISANNYGNKADEAKKNPVNIYVERNVAKVRLSAASLERLNDTDVQDEKLYKVFQKGEDKDVDYTLPDAKGEIKNVYVKLHRWDVTADVNYANFLKKIQEWRDTYFGNSVVWNRATLHRSYWADYCDPVNGMLLNQYFAYNGGTDAYGNNRFAKAKFDGTDFVYCNENAEHERANTTQLEEVKNTSVLIKASICDANGNNLYVAEYGGNRFIDDENYMTLKNRYITMMKGMKAEVPWRQDENAKTEKNPQGWVQMSAEDLDLIAAERINPAYIENKINTKDAAPYEVDPGRYYVFACLSEKAKTYHWFTNMQAGETEGTYNGTEIKDLELINKNLAELSHAKVWNNGMTYYYAEIQHLGSSVGAFGVVRNHLYDINLKKIYGLGTPVYDPTLNIEPEKPVDDNTYIAAQVNILSWRLVKNEITLDWD